MIYVDTEWYSCAYRNVHCTTLSELDQFLKDAHRLPEPVFRILYGDVYRYRKANNEIICVCPLKQPDPKPMLKRTNTSHKTDPRKGDLVEYVPDDGESYYGRIVWVNNRNDDCGVLVFRDDDVDTIELSTLDSVSNLGGKVRWRIYR